LMAPPGIVSLYGAETFEKVGYASLNKMYRNKTIESYENPFARKTEDFLYPDMTKRVQGQALMSNLWPLFWIGIACRFLALGGLFVFDRKQQNKTACIDIILNAIFSCFTCNCCKTKNSSAKPTRNFKQLSRQVTNFQMSMNPFFGEKKQSGRDSLASTKSAKLRKMYTDALQATSASVKDEGWLDRVQGHGLSSKVRQQRLDRKMGMLFDIWDKIGDGILDEDDMKSITKSLTSKVYAQFGDKESRQRLKNVGYVTPQTFSQFFDWFVISPTVDKICQTVEKANPKLTARDLQKRKRKSIMDQFSRKTVTSQKQNTSGGEKRRGRTSIHPKIALELRKKTRASTKALETLPESKNDTTANENKKPGSTKKGKKKLLKQQSTVYEPTFMELPKGWTEFFDSSQGKPYYYNHQTEVTQWERPI